MASPPAGSTPPTMPSRPLPGRRFPIRARTNSPRRARTAPATPTGCWCWKPPVHNESKFARNGTPANDKRLCRDEEKMKLEGKVCPITFRLQTFLPVRPFIRRLNRLRRAPVPSQGPPLLDRQKGQKQGKRGVKSRLHVADCLLPGLDAIQKIANVQRYASLLAVIKLLGLDWLNRRLRRVGPCPPLWARRETIPIAIHQQAASGAKKVVAALSIRGKEGSAARSKEVRVGHNSVGERYQELLILPGANEGVRHLFAIRTVHVHVLRRCAGEQGRLGIIDAETRARCIHQVNAPIRNEPPAIVVESTPAPLAGWRVGMPRGRSL